MVTVGLFVRIEAKPGKEVAIEKFLTGALPLVEAACDDSLVCATTGASDLRHFRCLPGQSTQRPSFWACRSGSDVGRDRSAAR